MAPQTPITVSHINNLQLAEEEEQKGNIDKAIQYYEDAIKDERADELPYNRLMILYRKEKKYKDELRIISKGIKVFTAFYKKSTSDRSKGKKLSDLSEAFMKSAGLKDKDGELVYQPEPIGKWTKRREVVEGKMKGTKHKANGSSQGSKGKAQRRTRNQDKRAKKIPVAKKTSRIKSKKKSKK
jgi:tetratricopeptide (TPR) repeat protein